MSTDIFIIIGIAIAIAAGVAFYRRRNKPSNTGRDFPAPKKKGDR